MKLPDYSKTAIIYVWLRREGNAVSHASSLVFIVGKSIRMYIFWGGGGGGGEKGERGWGAIHFKGWEDAHPHERNPGSFM